MALPRVGDRLGVLCHITKSTVYSLGGGTYLGNEVPPPDIRCCGLSPSSSGITMPKILLDQGGIVWGCEVYWAHESVIRWYSGNLHHVFVRLDDLRQQIDEFPATIACGHA